MGITSLSVSIVIDDESSMSNQVDFTFPLAAPEMGRDRLTTTGRSHEPMACVFFILVGHSAGASGSS